MYNVMSPKAEEFINHEEILDCLEYARQNKTNRELIDRILEKARERKGLSHKEAHCYVCAPVSVQLLYQWLRVLPLSCKKQAYCPEKADPGGDCERSNGPPGYGPQASGFGGGGRPGA